MYRFFVFGESRSEDGNAVFLSQGIVSANVVGVVVRIDDLVEGESVLVEGVDDGFGFGGVDDGDEVLVRIMDHPDIVIFEGGYSYELRFI